jgi:cytochrome c peroxidase
MKKVVAISCMLIIIAMGFLSGRMKEGPSDYHLTPYAFDLPDFVGIYFQPMNIPDNNPMIKEGVELGRKLFYEKRLSVDHSISCGSCHQQQFAFSDDKQFSSGVYQNRSVRNSMSLVNVGWGERFFWDGRVTSLEDQIGHPLTDTNEMGNTWEEVIKFLNEDSMYSRDFRYIFNKDSVQEEDVRMVIAQFLRTLNSFNTRFDQYYFGGQADVLTLQEERGLDIFFGFGGCNHCHSDVLLTDNFFRNNGLDSVPQPGLYTSTGNESDLGKMKVPTLRNIALTAPYMHDGRFETLNDVLDFYSEKINPKSPNLDEHIVYMKTGLRFSKEQKEDLIAFLHTLTDSVLITNPQLSDPN